LDLNPDLKSKSPPIIKNQAVNLGNNQLELRQRSHKLIVVLAFLNFSAPLYAQKIFPDVENSRPKIHNSINEKKWKKFSPIYVKKATFNFFPRDLNACPVYKTMFLAEDVRSVYKQGLGFICRQELKLDQLTAINIRFRLGSVDYVNLLEGKLNAAPCY
jgi:hypothetical protein